MRARIESITTNVAMAAVLFHRTGPICVGGSCRLGYKASLEVSSLVPRSRSTLVPQTLEGGGLQLSPDGVLLVGPMLHLVQKGLSLADRPKQDIDRGQSLDQVASEYSVFEPALSKVAGGPVRDAP